MEPGVLILIVCVVLLMVGLGIFSSIQARKRREALAELAARLGLNFQEDEDRNLPERFAFLDRLSQGSNRYAYNVLSGPYEGDGVLAFDYHYETHSTDAKGNRQTHHHHFSFFILMLPRAFPELIISPESFFSKIAQAIGFDDIDFESHEFSKKFCVRSKDKKFAYDVCHGRMMEYLLANGDLHIEFEDHALALGSGSCLDAAEIEANLQRLKQIRLLLPAYLFTNS